MGLFSSTQPSLRARILPRFPAQVLAGSGITITKSGGTYTFEANPQALTVTSDRLLGRDSAGSGAIEELTVSAGIGFTGAGGLQLQPNQRIRDLSIVLTGSPISTGIKGDIYVPFSCTLTKVTLLADQAGDIVLDVWKAAYGSFPPTVTETITAAAKPTLTNDLTYQDSVLSGWTVNVTAGDVLRFNVDSAATVTRVTVALDAVTV